MALRRSARNTKTSTVADTTSEAPKTSRARSAKAQSSRTNTTSRSKATESRKAKVVSKTVAGRTKRPRAPLSSRQTGSAKEVVDDEDDAEATHSGDAKDSHENDRKSEKALSPAAPITGAVAPLKDFMDDPADVTVDATQSDIDHKTVELVTSWQARADASPQPSRRIPFSSSLPPSSPLPPLPPQQRGATSVSIRSLSEFNPPSPQQEARFLEAKQPKADVENLYAGDISFDSVDEYPDSVVSDDFGFFAAQRKIHAKRDKEHNLAQGSAEGRTRHSDQTVAVEEVGNGSLDMEGPSFSGRLAFATPHVRRHSASPVSNNEEESPSKGIEQSFEGDKPSTSSPQVRPKRTRSSSRVRPGKEVDTESEPEKPKSTRGRPKKTGLPPVKPHSSNGRAVKSRKTSGSSTGTAKEKAKARPTRRKTAKTSPVHDDEEIDLDDGVATEEDDDDDELHTRERNLKAKKQRIAEFKALDDYELEVEDVIVF